MPQAYDVNWSQGGYGQDVANQFAQAQAVFRAGRERQMERERRAEQEQYERGQAEIQNQRQAADDERKGKAFEWEKRNLEVSAREQKFKEAKFKRDTLAQEAQRQGSEFMAAEPAAAQHQVDYFNPAPDAAAQQRTAAVPSSGYANAPAQMEIPALPGLAEGEPDMIAAKTISPFQMARAALEAKKAADTAEGLAKGVMQTDEKGAVIPTSTVNAREAAEQREETARLNRENTKAIADATRNAKGSMSESITQDINRLPDSWRNFNASHTTRDAFAVRNSEQATAIAMANANGKVLPTKKQGESIIAAKATLSDIDQAVKLMADPEVREYVGAYQGKMTGFLAKGWADVWGGESKVPAKVRKFRANLNRLAAEERHRIYGSALTAVESKFAEGFLPALDQSGSTVDAALAEYADDINRGMDALWGGSPDGESAPHAPAPAPAETAKAGPAVGAVVRGYRFKGGDPGAQASWEKVQ